MINILLINDKLNNDKQILSFCRNSLKIVYYIPNLYTSFFRRSITIQNGNMAENNYRAQLLLADRSFSSSSSGIGTCSLCDTISWHAGRNNNLNIGGANNEGTIIMTKQDPEVKGQEQQQNFGSQWRLGSYADDENEEEEEEVREIFAIFTENHVSTTVYIQDLVINPYFPSILQE